MARIFVADLQPNIDINQVFRILDKTLRTNRQGSLYLHLMLGDRTGTVTAMRWNIEPTHAEGLDRGDFVLVRGTTQLFNGQIQIIARDIDHALPASIQADDFEAQDQARNDALWATLNQMLDSVTEPHLRRLVDALLADDALVAAFRQAPAAVKNHHSQVGGLLQHVVDLMRLAEHACQVYPQVDRQLLLVGIWLHDIGKIEELRFDGELSYSQPGQLLGHLVQGVLLVDRAATQLAAGGEPIPEVLLWRIHHMILSHHGRLEHGSPKLPMTLEAILLHQLDNLDAKVNACIQLIQADRDPDSEWTNYQPALERKLFKPSCLPG
jgi:3'-5' exoribonuclease